MSLLIKSSFRLLLTFSFAVFAFEVYESQSWHQNVNGTLQPGLAPPLPVPRPASVQAVVGQDGWKRLFQLWLQILRVEFGTHLECESGFDDLLFVVLKMHPYVRNVTQQRAFGPQIWQKCKICAVTTMRHKHIPTTYLVHDLNDCS